MKKMILLTILLFLTANVHAESPTDKGVYGLGGSISYRNIDRDSGSDLNVFQISPSVRYFIYDNIAVGVSLEYEKWNGSIDSKTYGIGPTLRYYFPNITANPFLEAGYTYSKIRYEIPNLPAKVSSNDYSIAFGLDLFLSRNVSIEPIVKYSWKNYKDEMFSTPGDIDEKTLYMGIGVNLFIF